MPFNIFDNDMSFAELRAGIRDRTNQVQRLVPRMAFSQVEVSYVSDLRRSQNSAFAFLIEILTFAEIGARHILL
ncbi:hypothetical protein PanWU01x14_153620 [Parasponia andersonii]|uniref:Uncharacterized protein n=1 Tax=Parasponia andersonii TaxID=3476 RepID=A0A2P5CH51_PARAD|nr:hypothetical protein PanWU01x14_153620 [Parasponia andersonii]